MVETYYLAQFTEATLPVPQADRVGTMLHLHRVPLPEDVEGAFEVASPVHRVAAFALDIGIILGVGAGVILLALITPLGSVMGMFAPGVLQAFLFLLFGVLNTGYFMIFEGFFAGRTPGKAALKLRVIRKDGFEVGPREGLIRAFMRMVVIGPLPLLAVFGVFSAELLMAASPFAALGLLMFVDPRGRALADFVAGTMVVYQRASGHYAQRPHVPLYFQLPHHYFPLSHEEMSHLTPDDYVRLEEFGTRLSTIRSTARRHAAMSAAAALATRMQYSRPIAPDYAEIFLFEMHAALKQQLQQLYPDLYQ